MLTKEIQSQEENVLNGFSCVVCGFNFEERYGQMGKDFTHVHHLKELSQIGEEYEINNRRFTTSLSNCHSMLHKRKPAYSIEELKIYYKSI